MTKICLALRHVPFEDLGLTAPLLEERGYAVRYVDVAVEAVDPAEVSKADLCVVLGGPIGVYETDHYPFLSSEIEAVAGRLAARRPTLGICLGAQIMAVALGARVAPGRAKEIGWRTIDLTQDGRASPLGRLEGVAVLHWHGDAFDLPQGAKNLASTPDCPHQAFLIDDHALALQFHIEADPARIEQWLVGHAVELAQAGVPPRAIRREAALHGAATAAAGRDVLNEWLSKSEAIR